jgi:hypothetical protein
MKIAYLIPAVFIMLSAFIIYLTVGYSFIRKNKEKKDGDN